MDVQQLRKDKGCGESGFSLQAVETYFLIQDQSWIPNNVFGEDK